MKRLLISILIIGLFFCLPSDMVGQAGIGLRHLDYKTPSQGLIHLDTVKKQSKFAIGLHYRWFDADVPYSSDLRQTELEAANEHEIFNKHAVNIALSYQLTPRWSFHVGIPLVYNQKSSVYEHSLVNGTFITRQRRVTEAIGLGDVFVMTNYAFVVPDSMSKTSIVLGGGVKLPTGAFDAMDDWQNIGPMGTSVRRPVDPVIQPGDGTWAAIADIQLGHELTNWLGLYGGARYLASFASSNGVMTFRSTFSEEFREEDLAGVSDQYMVRGGVTLTYPGLPLWLSLGLRVDGVPVNDMVSGREGFRRPGFATSFENSLSYRGSGFEIYANVPIIYYQKRLMSNADRRFTANTGQFRHGDASFAPFAIFTGVRVFL